MTKANIVLLEEEINRVVEVVNSLKIEGEIKEVSAFILPTTTEVFSKVSYPDGHAPIDYSNVDVDDEVFNQSTPEIRSYFLENNFMITVVRDKKKVVKYEVLQNADIILPIITFVGKTAFVIGTTVLGRYIYEKYVVPKPNSNTTVEADVVHFETDSIKYKRYKVSGSAPEVVEALKNLSQGNEVK